MGSNKGKKGLNDGTFAPLTDKVAYSEVCGRFTAMFPEILSEIGRVIKTKFIADFLH